MKKEWVTPPHPLITLIIEYLCYDYLMIVVSFFEGKPMSVVREGMSATIVILISGLLTSWQNQILGYSIARQIQNYV